MTDNLIAGGFTLPFQFALFILYKMPFGITVAKAILAGTTVCSCGEAGNLRNVNKLYESILASSSPVAP